MKYEVRTEEDTGKGAAKYALENHGGVCNWLWVSWRCNKCGETYLKGI